MRSLIDDLRYGVRTLLNAPGFTAVALLTLALGIGGNTAVFSLTYAALLRPLPVHEPDRLAVLGYLNPKARSSGFGLSQPLIEDIARRQSVFSGIMAWRDTALTLNENGEARRLEVALASGNAFDVLGIRPALGRAIAPEDDHEGGGPSGWAAMLNYSFWQAHYHGDPQVLGRSIEIEGVAATIVGVAPAHFDSVAAGSRADVILPLAFDRILVGKPQPGAMMYAVLGRLKPGVTLQQAQAHIASFSAQVIAENDPQFILRRGFFAGGQIHVSSGKFGREGPASSLREELFVLEALVGIVLLICCANVAGLLSARLAARQHELAVRAALGASRARLLRQLALEALLLCAAGAVAAVLTADSIAPVLLRTLLPRSVEMGGPEYVALSFTPDWRVLLFTFSLALASALLIMVFPGLRATRVDVARDLSAGTQKMAGSRSRSEGWIVSGQVAFASLLVVAAGLFASTVYHLLSIDPGYRTSGVVVVPTDLHLVAKTNADLAALYERLIERLRTMPGVESASAEQIPMLNDWIASTNYASVLKDGSLREDEHLFFNAVGADYFAASGTRILAGRDFQSLDRDSKHMVCALNQSAADYFFPQGNAVGSSVSDYSSKKLGDPCEVIAVVADTKYTNLMQTPPHIVYWTFMENFGEGLGSARWELYLVLRTADPALAAASARQALRELAPGAPALTPITMNEQLRESIGTPIAMASLAVAFALLALLLTALGLYGTLSYQVNRRTREIAIRMAVGADAGDVVRMVVRRALLLTAAGLVLGLIAAGFTAPLLRSMLFGVRPVNPIALAGAAVLLLAIAAVASFLPARRATEVDPMLALRAE